MHAATGAALQNACEALGGLVGNIHREVRHHQEAIGLSNLAGLFVVCLNRWVLVAQVLLNDRLHVLSEVRKSLLNVTHISPDSISDQQFHLVCQVHEPGETLAEPHWVHEDEACFASGNGNQESGNRVLQDAQPISAALGGSINQERHALGRAEKCRHSPRRGCINAGPRELGSGWQGAGHILEIQGHLAHANHCQWLQRRLP